jgi:hypothetical protein
MFQQLDFLLDFVAWTGENESVSAIKHAHFWIWNLDGFEDFHRWSGSYLNLIILGLRVAQKEQYVSFVNQQTENSQFLI